VPTRYSVCIALRGWPRQQKHPPTCSGHHPLKGILWRLGGKTTPPTPAQLLKCYPPPPLPPTRRSARPINKRNISTTKIFATIRTKCQMPTLKMPRSRNRRNAASNVVKCHDEWLASVARDNVPRLLPTYACSQRTPPPKYARMYTRKMSNTIAFFCFLRAHVLVCFHIVKRLTPETRCTGILPYYYRICLLVYCSRTTTRRWSLALVANCGQWFPHTANCRNRY